MAVASGSIVEGLDTVRHARAIASSRFLTYTLRYEVSLPNDVARQLLITGVYATAATVKGLR
jgi:hypothetical protein